MSGLAGYEQHELLHYTGFKREVCFWIKRDVSYCRRCGDYTLAQGRILMYGARLAGAITRPESVPFLSEPDTVVFLGARREKSTSHLHGHAPSRTALPSGSSAGCSSIQFSPADVNRS